MHLLLYPGHTLPTAAAPVLVAAGLAVHDGVLAPWPLLLAFVGSWLIHIAGVFADNHELLRRHRALPEHPELCQALADGSLRLSSLRWTIAACLVLAALCGIEPVRLGGWPAFALGVVGVAASLGYAAGPAYARRGYADPLFLVMFGVLAVVGCYGIQVAATRPGTFAWTALPWSAWVLGMPVGCLVVAVMVIDDIRDRDWDRQKGWRTPAVRFGVDGARRLFVALLVLAYAAPLLYWLGLGRSPWVMTTWATLPLAGHVLRAVLRHDTTRELLPMSPRTSLLSLLFAGLLAVGLAA
ncbi:MAG: UbiA family prenyltransferase [Planctomycetes bacterium]|nr:UbiA family prenyltransferase [Planctomycetota bacterium]